TSWPRRSPYPTAGSLLADVLVPQVGIGGDERRHHLDTRRVVEHFDGDTALTEQVFGTHERPVLAHHHPRDPVEEDRPGAHRARRQGRVDGGPAVSRRRQPARVLQRVHLAMEDRRALLDTAVVT